MNDSLKKQFVDTQVAAFSENDQGDGHLLNKHLIVMDMVTRHADKNSYILDVGCSDGKILKELEQQGYTNLYGIDIQEESKNTFLNHNIHYQACDIEHEKIPFPRQFDIIIVSDVLEHLFSPQTVLYDLKSSLSAKGKIVFSVPNAGWFLNGLLLTFFPSKLFVSTAFGPWGHTYQFTFYQARKIANILKYKIIELKGGSLDNYAFKVGLKKRLFDIFAWISLPLLRRWPVPFSAHIFGVFENTRAKVPVSARFDIGL